MDLLDLCWRGRAIKVLTHDFHPEARVPGHAGDVHRGWLFLQPREEVLQWVLAESVLPDEHCRDALPDHDIVWLFEDAGIGMAVHVDEPRRQRQAAAVQSFLLSSGLWQLL